MSSNEAEGVLAGLLGLGLLWVLLMLAGMFVSGAIGWAAGGGKTGFWWGFFLGPWGWVIAAIRERTIRDAGR